MHKQELEMKPALKACRHEDCLLIENDKRFRYSGLGELFIRSNLYDQISQVDNRLPHKQVSVFRFTLGIYVVHVGRTPHSNPNVTMLRQIPSLYQRELNDDEIDQIPH